MMQLALSAMTPLSTKRGGVDRIRVAAGALPGHPRLVPLGHLNDVSAVRKQDSAVRLLTVTLIQTLPFAFGLFYSIKLYGEPHPGWLMRWLFISYLVLLVRQLRAWWIPYLVRLEPERAERYRAMFGRTHSFLMERNGIVPNTAHILLHTATFVTLCLFLLR